MKNRTLKLTAKCLFLSVFVFFAISQQGFTQIVAWNTSGLTGVTSGNVGATTNNGGLNTSFLSRGGGLVATSLSNGYASSGFTDADQSTAIANGKYYQISISPQNGFRVSLSTLDARFRRSSTGPINYVWQYSLDGTTYADISSPISFTTSGSTGDAQSQISLSGISALQNVSSGTTVSLRVYGWGASGTAGTFSFGTTNSNSLAIGGNVVSTLSTANTWSTSGTNLYSLNSGNVGIGITSPTSKLHISGLGSTNVDLLVSGRIKSGGVNTGGFWAGDNAFIGLDGSGNNILHLYNGGWRMMIAPNGNVGIGTATTGINAKLTVNGNALINGPLTIAGALQFLDGSVMNSASVSNTWSTLGNNFYSLNSGNIGIGTNAPIAKLSVEGNAIITGPLTVSGGLQFADGSMLNSASVVTSWSNVTVTGATGNVQNYVLQSQPVNIQNTLKLGTGSLFLSGTTENPGSKNEIYTSGTDPVYIQGQQGANNGGNTFINSYNGKVYIGSSQTGGSSDALLNVNGGIKINSGTIANGNVLTSDANGVGTWAPFSLPTQLWTPLANDNTIAVHNVGGIQIGGDILLNDGADRKISISSNDMAGRNLTIQAGSQEYPWMVDAILTGGDLNLKGGDAGAFEGGFTGGNVNISAGRGLSYGITPVYGSINIGTSGEKVTIGNPTTWSSFIGTSEMEKINIGNVTIPNSVERLNINGNIKFISAGNGLFFANNGEKIFSPSNRSIEIQTNGISRLTVDVNGKVGIGTNTPNYNLHIKSLSAQTDQTNVSIGLEPNTWATNSSATIYMGSATNYIQGKKYTGGPYYDDQNNYKFHFVGGDIILPSEYQSMRFGPEGDLAKQGRIQGDDGVYKRLTIYHPQYVKLTNNAPCGGAAGCDPWEKGLFVNNNKVGIGTSTPVVDLHVLGKDQSGNVATTSFLLGGQIAGNTFLSMGTSAASGGYCYIRAAKSHTVAWGDLILNEYGGNVGIGTNTPSAPLEVNGNTKISGTLLVGATTYPSAASCTQMYVNGVIGAQEVRVSQTSWCDYVFDEKYILVPLEEVEAYIKTNKHLPEVPSEKEVVDNGMGLGEMSKLHMKKIEELTLYMIELKKQNDQLSEEVSALKKLVVNK